MASLNDYTWTEISAIAGSGKASTTFSLGDTKDITLTTGEVITVRIIGFDHDDLADGSGKASITFEMEACLRTRYPFRLETSGIGWDDSYIRTLLQPGGEIYDILPADVKKYIVDVIKLSFDKGANAVLSSKDRVWLLSETEVYGDVVYSSGKQGGQYPFYLPEETNLAKFSPSENKNIFWALRSNNATATGPCGINAVGVASAGSSTVAVGISFAFCIDGTLPTFTPAEFLRWFSLGQAVRRGVGARVEQWETVFEGTVTTEENTNINGCNSARLTDDTATWFVNGDSIRITVDGDSAVVPAYMIGFSQYAAGNLWLRDSTSNVNNEDDGYDFLLQYSIVNNHVFYSRYPGTYNVKIERKVS